MHEPPWSDRSWRRVSTAAVGAVCVLWLVGVLWISRGHYPASPDTFHHGIVARNLVRGDGFKINMIQYHVGRFADVEHVPEMHGILQPIALAGLFAFAGPQRALFRVPGFVYVSLTGFVAFLFARRVFGTGAGLVACALTLSSNLLLFWAWFGEDDAGFACWFLVALYSLDVAIEKRSDRRFAVAGLAAAFALLQKLSGMILLAPMLAILLDRGTSLRSRLRSLAIWLAPWSLALALCLARNQVASGGWMFRFGPIDWIYKARGLEAFFGVYDSMPSLFSVLDSLGFERVISIVLKQLADFARAALWPAPIFGFDPMHRIMAPAFLSIVGLAALALHARRRPRFAALFALSLLGAVGFVCGIWHFEVRFFTLLVPLLAISIGGAVAAGRPAAQAPRSVAFARVTAGVGLALVALSVWAFVLALQVIPSFAGPEPCGAARDWIRRETAASDRILTFDPWTTSWETERATIVVPSGPRSDVEKVIAWYRPTWLFFEPRPLRFFSLRRIQAMVANPTAAFSASRVFVDGDCAIYRIATSGSGTTLNVP
jgi:hypothetical protein